MLKKFLTYSETAIELGTDNEGLRQGFETGVAKELPAFVYCGDRPFLAKLIGVERAEFDEATETSLVTLKNGVAIKDSFFSNHQESPPSVGDMELGDDLGDVMFTSVPPSQTGYPGAFALRGFFRVASYEMKNAAREGSLGMARVAPASWWEGGVSPLFGFDNERPGLYFMLKPTNLSQFRELPDLIDVYFRANDVRAFASKASASQQNTGEDPDKPLDTRERITLLNIIGALANAANIDLGQPYKAGNAISAMLRDKSVKVGGRRIGDYLKAVNEAMDSRKT